MTTGTTRVGTSGAGYYRYRQWSGADGMHSEEHPFSWAVNESLLIPVKYRYKGSTGTWKQGSMNTFRPTPPLSVTGDYTANLVNCCTQKVWQDLTQSRFNAGVFSGEFKESYHMTCDIVHSLAKGVQFAKKGRWDKAFKLFSLSRDPSITGTAANSYMMMHFGILPLLNDLKGLVDYMQTTYKVVKRVRRHCVFKNSTTVTHNTGVQWIAETKQIAEVRGNVEMVELSPIDRLGLNDPVAVAWELTKLSWMIDWILPIGNFLEAVNASNRTQGSTFFVTRARQWKEHTPNSGGCQYDIVPFDGSAFLAVSDPGAGNNRSILTALPWVFPTIKDPLGDNLSHWVTSFAFLRQVVGRG